MLGLCEAAITSLVRSSGLATFWLDRPVGSTKCELAMPSFRGLGIHGGDHRGHPAGIIVPQRMRGAVFGRHQGQVHQVAPGQGGADGEARKRRPSGKSRSASVI